MNKKSVVKPSGIGGQAVLEGVMMKNKDRYAVAVRKPDGEIEVEEGTCKSLRDKYFICDLPIIRGVVTFVESLVLGMKSLTDSSKYFEDEEDDAEEIDEDKKEKREKVEEIKEQDDGFYRIEKNFFRSVNDPMAVNMYGLSHSSSTLNARAIDMLGYFGFTSNGHYSRFSGNTPLTSDIFGVKYILDCAGESTANIKTADDITVTENKDALPIGYLADSKVSSLELSKYDVFDNQNKLLNAMTGGNREFFTVFSADGEPYVENCKKGSFENQHIGFTDVTGEASVTYTITAPKSGEIYMFIPTDYQREASLYVNGTYKGICFESDNHNIKDLGRFEKGEEVTVKLALKKSDLYFREPQFAVYNEEAETAAIAQMWEKNADTKVEKVSQTDIRFTVNAKSNDILFTTIPAEKGWTVYVDGVKTDYDTALNDALMTVKLSEGEHVVEFRFFAAGLGTGLIVTVIGIAIFVGLILVLRKIKKPVKLTKAVNEAADIDNSETDDIIENDISEESEDKE